MKVFECDICFKSFRPGKKTSINAFEFMHIDINDSELNYIVNTSESNLPKKVDGCTCFYNICPDCVEALRDTLWSLRNKSKEGDQNEQRKK